MPSGTDRSAWDWLLVLFALPPACVALSRLALWLFVDSVSAEPATPLPAIASFLLTAAAGWAGVVFGLLLAVGLALDSYWLGHTDADWRPTPLYALAGLAHAAGTMLLLPFAVSIPVVGYYLLRRRRTLPAGGRSDRGG